MMAIANIPFKVFEFKGIICDIIVDNKEYKFTTYNNSRIIKYIANDNLLSITLKKNNYYLEVKSLFDKGLKLSAPVKGKMQKNIFESISANVIKYGLAYSSERLFSRIFLLLYGVLASHMGTENYSIHTICYSVCLSLEIITNAYQATLMIKVPQGKTYQEQYNNCMSMKKQCFKLIILLNYIFAFIYLLISHGSLPLYKCFPYIIFYSFGVFGLYPYETYKTLCITQGKSYILLIGSTVGVIIRFIICLIFINTSITLFVFGVVNFIDFYFRSIVYRIVLKKVNIKSI